MIGKIFKHKDKTAGKYAHDGEYKLDAYVRMKDPTTGEWIDAVLYGGKYVRSKSDFEDKFEEA